MFDLLTPHLSVDWNGIEELKNFDEKAKEHLKIYHRAGIFLWVIHVLMLKVYDNSEAIRYHNFKAVCFYSHSRYKCNILIFTCLVSS